MNIRVGVISSLLFLFGALSSLAQDQFEGRAVVDLRREHAASIQSAFSQVLETPHAKLAVIVWLHDYGIPIDLDTTDRIREIEILQDRVVQQLPPTEVVVTRRYKVAPGFAALVTRVGMRKLLSNSVVSYVQHLWLQWPQLKQVVL